jgi:hypothetical protein
MSTTFFLISTDQAKTEFSLQGNWHLQLLNIIWNNKFGIET